MGDFADVYVRVSENVSVYVTYLTTKFSKTPGICTIFDNTLFEVHTANFNDIWILLKKKKKKKNEFTI